MIARLPFNRIAVPFAAPLASFARRRNRGPHCWRNYLADTPFFRALIAQIIATLQQCAAQVGEQSDFPCKPPRSVSVCLQGASPAG
jgi:hypothetical protein